MLPLVVFQNQVLIALLIQTILEFRRNVWTGIHVVLDRPILTDERLKFDFPTVDQNADIRKITLRR